MALPTFIVEDNPVVLQGVTEALDDFVSVDWLGQAAGAIEAIVWLQANPSEWRLLIVDLFLVDGSGLDVVASCCGRSACQHVVVLTNYATSDIRRRALELGADAVFDKSTEIEEMLEFCVELAES
ncbi:hypothetical protein BH11PSE8_BH11PSE8_32630 [soil metagenome]